MARAAGLPGMTERIPGKGFQDLGRGAPLAPGKQTLTSQLDAEVDPLPRNDAPEPPERPRGGNGGRY